MEMSACTDHSKFGGNPKLFLIFLISFIFVISTASAESPQSYNGYDTGSWLNVTTNAALDLGKSAGAINISSWFETTIGKVTETVWLPYEMWILLFIVGILFFILATSEKSPLIYATFAFACFALLYVNGPFVTYHGVQSASYVSTATGTPEIYLTIQPWQEVYLINSGLVYLLAIFFFASALNWFYSVYVHISQLSHPKPISVPQGGLK